MFLAKRTFPVAVALALVMVSLAAGSGAAQTAFAAPPIQSSTPQLFTIPYAGQLNDATGSPVPDGTYDFIFSLYDAPEGGNLLWTGTQAGVTVRNGDFSASIGGSAGLPAAVRERKESWLAVSVRGPGEAGFTLLEPRELLPATGPTGVSALSCPHSHFPDNWSGSNSEWGLRVENTGVGDGLRTYSKATAWNYAAVFGANVATTGSGTGVYAFSNMGVGMLATSNKGDGVDATTNVSAVGTKSAVYGHSDKGNGVWGVSTSAVGVHGASNTGRGVEAFSNSSNMHAGWFESANYGGLYSKAVKAENYYAVVVDRHIHVLGDCTGCAVIYYGMNRGDALILPGDLVATAGVEIAPATGEPVLLVRRAVDAGDAVIGVALGPAAGPSKDPTVIRNEAAEVASDATAGGEYLRIMVSGLAQVRVGARQVAIGEHLLPGANGAVAAADTSASVARALSAPDADGLVWAMISGQ